MSKLAKKFRLVALPLVFICLSPLRLLASQIVLLAVEDSWPPYATHDGTGISRTIVESAFEKVGFQVEFIVVPYARALKMAEKGEVDGVFNVTRQASTEQRFYFGKYPILQAKASFYYAPNYHHEYQSIAQHPSKLNFALIIGYEYGNQFEALKSKFNEVRVNNQEQIIRLLMSGRVEAAIMFDEVAAYTLKEMKLERNVIQKGAVNHVSDIYVAFSKSAKRKGVKGMMQALDRGLEAIKKR